MTQDPAERATVLADAARAGDRRSLARLLTAVENHTAVAEHALRRLYPLAGAAHLVGITGPPGAGKLIVAGVSGTTQRVQARNSTLASSRRRNRTRTGPPGGFECGGC